MIVLWRTGAAGVEVGVDGDGGGAVVVGGAGASVSFFAAAAAAAAVVDFWRGERRMAPLGLTRPVPCTSPPAVRARMVPVLLRVIAAFAAEEKVSQGPGVEVGLDLRAVGVVGGGAGASCCESWDCESVGAGVGAGAVTGTCMRFGRIWREHVGHQVVSKAMSMTEVVVGWTEGGRGTLPWWRGNGRGWAKVGRDINPSDAVQ